MDSILNTPEFDAIMKMAHMMLAHKKHVKNAEAHANKVASRYRKQFNKFIISLSPEETALNLSYVHYLEEKSIEAFNGWSDAYQNAHKIDLLYTQANDFDDFIQQGLDEDGNYKTQIHSNLKVAEDHEREVIRGYEKAATAEYNTQQFGD